MKKILLIEDNVDVRETTADILELSDYEVIPAKDGRLGVKKAQKYIPDLIICDIMMPELDGYEVLQILNKSPKTATIPFIFLTAKSEKVDIRKGMNLGADDYLVKPFEEHELLEAIESRLKKNHFLKRKYSKSIAGIHDFIEEASEYMDLEGFTRKYQLKTYKKKSDIFIEGCNAHKLCFIQSGVIKTYKITAAGKEFITGIYGPGDFIGQLSLLFKEGTNIESATVIEDAEVCEIPKEDFMKLIYGNRVVANKFIDMISHDLIDMRDQMMHMAFAPVRQRVAKVLLELHGKVIVKNKINSGIDIPREDFAGIIGTATETAIRMLSKFKDEGLISMGTGRKLILLDKNRLRRIANFN